MSKITIEKMRDIVNSAPYGALKLNEGITEVYEDETLGMTKNCATQAHGFRHGDKQCRAR